MAPSLMEKLKQTKRMSEGEFGERKSCFREALTG